MITIQELAAMQDKISELELKDNGEIAFIKSKWLKAKDMKPGSR